MENMGARKLLGKAGVERAVVDFVIALGGAEGIGDLLRGGAQDAGTDPSPAFGAHLFEAHPGEVARPAEPAVAAEPALRHDIGGGNPLGDTIGTGEFLALMKIQILVPQRGIGGTPVLRKSVGLPHRNRPPGLDPVKTHVARIWREADAGIVGGRGFGHPTVAILAP